MPVLNPSANTLPVEILAQIFVLWALVDEDAPWMASAVCRHWRRIILAYPVAWSNVTHSLKVTEAPPTDDDWCVEEDALEERNSPRNKPRPLDLWLWRNAGTEFALTIYTDVRYPLVDIKVVENCRKLQGHLYRLCDLTLDVESGDFADSLLWRLTSLGTAEDPLYPKNLRISIRPEKIPRIMRGPRPTFDYKDDLLEGFWDSLNACDSITLEFCKPPSVQHIEDKLFDPSQLRRFTLRHVSMTTEHLLGILQHFDNLEVLTLQGIRPPFHFNLPEDGAEPAPAPRRVTLPALTRLILSTGTMFCTALLPRLHTPELTHSSLTNDGLGLLRGRLAEGASPVDATADFGDALWRFAQSAPSVTSFRLAESPLHDKYLVNILAAWPALQELDFVALLVGIPALRRLTPSHAASSKNVQPPICPNLQILRVEKCDLLSGDPLVSLAQSRNDSASTTRPLTSLAVTQCEHVKPTHIAQLRRVDPTRLRIHWSP